MVQLEKKENRGPGDRLPIGEVKSEIISYILSKNDAVPVTDLIKHLRERYGIKNKKNINNHLSELKNNNCIEKVDPFRNGFENRWNITEIENLKNIKILFPEIQLNKYEKSISVVLKKFNFAIGSMRAKKAFVQLSLSISFFNKFLDNDIETLYIRALKFGQFERSFSLEQTIEKSIQKFTQEAYLECIRRIQKIPGIWPIDDEYVENPVNLDINQNSSQRFQNSVISEEKFKRMLKEIIFSLEEKDAHEQTKRFAKELSMKLSHEIFSKRLEESSRESLQNQEVLNKMSDDIYTKIIEESPKDLPEKIYIIIKNQYQNTDIIFDKIFYHFYQRDIIDGSDSHEEQEFVSEMTNLTALNMTMKLDLWKEVEELNNLYNDHYEICRKNMGII